MNRVKEISLSVLSTTELHSLADETVAVLSPLVDAHPNIESSLEVIKESLFTLSILQDIPQGEELSTQIENIEVNLYDSLRQICETLTRNIGMAAYDPGKAGASGRLLELFCQRFPMLFDEYSEESNSEVTDLLGQIFHEDLRRIRSNSGIAHSLESVKLRNSLLEDLRAVRDKKQQSASTHAPRKLLEWHVDSLLTYMDSNSLQNNDFAQMVPPLNDIITSVIKQQAQRRDRGLEN